MHQSLLQLKELHKKELQHQLRKIEEALKLIMPHQIFSDLPMRKDEDLLMRCTQVYHYALVDLKKLEPLGISQVTLTQFNVKLLEFSALYHDVNK